MTAAPPSVGQQAGWIVGLTLLLLWPAIWSGSPLGFPDTPTYYAQGGAVLRIAGDVIGLDPAVVSVQGDASEPGTGLRPGNGVKSFDGNIRSVPYAILMNASIRIAGLFGPIVLVALVTAALLMMLMDGVGWRRRLVTCLALAFLSNVAFYTSQLMPDILAAWLIVIPMILLRRDGVVGPVAGLTLLAAATFATMAHYAHIPLAAFMGVAVSIWALRRGRSTMAILAQLPLIATLAFNLVLSVALPGGSGGGGGGGGGASIAPARHPILLARALEDGVAIRYLEAHCDERRFTICEVYDTFPTTVQDTLWTSSGVKSRATPEQFRAVSAEELPLLWQVFLFDPLGQTRALLSNSVEQLFRFGLGDVYPASLDVQGPKIMEIALQKPRPTFFHVAAGIQYAVVPLAVLSLLAGWRRISAAERGMVLIGALGLAVNAAICGGLSVPTDRYQGRIIWLVVLAAVLVWPWAPSQAGVQALDSRGPAADRLTT